MGGKILILFAAMMAAVFPQARADGPGRIYTQPAAADAGILSGSVKGAVLTHALAVERDRTRVYRAVLNGEGTEFRFEKLPVGRFDLVLVTKDNRVIEGLALGPAPDLPEDRVQHLAQGVAKADSFFNRHHRQRTGIEGGVALVLVERIRDRRILRGSGEEIDANLRRLEIIELREAGDEWQMVKTRHLLREETPRIKGIPFLVHQHHPALGGLRIASAPRDLGVIDLTRTQQP
jgi:hypothetical protein